MPAASAAPPSPQVLAAAVALVDTDPRAALDAFRKIEGTLVPDAYLGYLLVDSGKENEGEAYRDRARSALSTEADSMAAYEQGESEMLRTLRVLRLAIEEGKGPDPSIPIACGLFAKHGKEAVQAFGAMWGSTRDSYGRTMKNHCIGELLRRAAPEKAEPVLKAQGALFDAMHHVAEEPDGTMFYAMFCSDSDILRNVILAPELGVPAPERPLAEAVAKGARHDPRIPGRMAAYKATAARSDPVIADGICAILAARGRAADAAACKALAEAASTEAIAQWLMSVSVLDE